jgi:hypothetical protein
MSLLMIKKIIITMAINIYTNFPPKSEMTRTDGLDHSKCPENPCVTSSLVISSMIELNEKINIVKNKLMGKINLFLENKQAPESLNDYKKLILDVMDIDRTLYNFMESIITFMKTNINSSLQLSHGEMAMLSNEIMTSLENLRSRIFRKAEAFDGYKSNAEKYFIKNDFAKINTILENIQLFEINMTKFRGKIIVNSQ